jgi:hypothetical protein
VIAQPPVAVSIGIQPAGTSKRMSIARHSSRSAVPPRPSLILILNPRMAILLGAGQVLVDQHGAHHRAIHVLRALLGRGYSPTLVQALSDKWPLR